MKKMRKLSLLLGTLGGAAAGYLFSNKKLRDQLQNAKDSEEAAHILGEHLKKDGKHFAKQVQDFVHSDAVQENITKAKSFANEKVSEAKKELGDAWESGSKKAKTAAKKGASKAKKSAKKSAKQAGKSAKKAGKTAKKRAGKTAKKARKRVKTSVRNVS